jgi:hypothetical protein
MAIGGKREGAGRKSAWRSPTKMMRLPQPHEQQILDYARLLDSDSESNGGAGAEANDSESKSFTELEIAEAIAAVVMSVRPGDRRAANALFKKLLAKLEETCSPLHRV